MSRLMIIVPCFNEQEVLNNTCAVLTTVLEDMIFDEKIDKDSGILFVDDGSTDFSFEIIKELNQSNKYVYGLQLAGNSGHQNAIMAGISAAADMCDISVTIDADLQDDPEAIKAMVQKYENGADIVFGVRSDRKSDSSFKRSSAQAFYKLMSALGAKTVYNHADFRLLSRRAMKHLLSFKEQNLFLRGIVANMGYKTDTVYYTRTPRKAGESKYKFSKMLSLAWQGITSFSIKPISLILAVGFIIVLLSFAAFIYTLISFFLGKTVPGWSSIMISVWFLGGVQLLSVGIIGQYVGKTYIESKRRPRYNPICFLNQNKDGEE